MQTNYFSLLPISVFHAARVVDLPFHHRDPFDRLIIAQSLVEGMPVVSSDDTFDRMASSESGESGIQMQKAFEQVHRISSFKLPRRHEKFS